MTIQRIEIEAHGGPEVMHLAERPTPKPGPEEILVRHTACGVNYIDTYQRSGLYAIPLPSGLGLEAAGVIETIGDGVSGWRVGQRVAYCSGPAGAYSDAHVVKADRLVALPDGVSDDQAAASLLKGLTVQYLIRQIYPVQAGETVLFHAIAGGVGQIALQWLKHIGATVIGTVGSEEKAELARDLGCDHVILYDRENVAHRVREITKNVGVPVVFDGVGADTFAGSLDSLRQKGLLVSFGNASGPVTNVDLGILAAKGSLFVTRPTLFHYTASREDLDEAAADFLGAVARGEVKIPDPTVRPLAEAADAHRDLESRATTGATVLRP